MGRKVYKVGEKYSVGLFDDNGEMLKGSSPKYFKTKKGAEKYLDRLKR